MRVRQQSKAWCWCLCLGLALMLAGVVVGGAYLYREFLMQACGTDSIMVSCPNGFFGVVFGDVNTSVWGGGAW